MDRKFNVNEQVRIKQRDGTYKEPPRDAKGSIGTVAPQCTADWLEAAGSSYAETFPSYYVELANGDVALIGEDWLEPATGTREFVGATRN
jgi:hypothetical protein